MVEYMIFPIFYTRKDDIMTMPFIGNKVHKLDIKFQTPQLVIAVSNHFEGATLCHSFYFTFGFLH